MPITEAEAVAALPAQGWVREYVKHAALQTTSPIVYHLGVGLTTLAATCPLNYGTRFAGVLRPNNFCLLVGRSGEDNKSTALNIGKNLLYQSASSLVGQFPGSPEGLVDSLERQNTQCIPISELGKFLSSAKSGYFEPIKALLADVWDCQSLERAKANKKVIEVKHPRLSITAACSLPYLEKYTLAEDWTGGFMGRWMVLYGRRERVDPNPVGDKTREPWLVDQLTKRATTLSAGWCAGMDPIAAQMWDDWYYDMNSRKLPNNIVGIKSRAPTMAMKVALLYGWDFGPAILGKPWEISLKELDPAIRLIELHIKSLIHLSDKIADHEDGRMRRAVLQAIDQYGGIATLGEILSVLKRRKRPVYEALDGLMEEGRVVKRQTSLGSVAYENQGQDES